MTKFLFKNKEDLAKELNIENTDHFYVKCEGKFIT